MSLISRAIDGRAAGERRGITEWTRIPTNGEIGGVDAGVPVTERSALNHIAYYAAVRTMADTIASLPWDGNRKATDGSRQVLPRQPPLLVLPWRGDAGDATVFEWKNQLAVALIMRGNGYGHVEERDRLEFPTQIRPLHPDTVTRRRESGRVVTRIGGEVVPNADVLHVRGLTLPGQLEGLSPLNAARHAIGLGLAAQRFGGRWFADSAAPASTLTTDQKLSPNQVTATQQQWMDTHGGRRRPAIMSGGLKYEAISITPEESQFLGTREFSAQEMAMLVGLPPHMIGLTTKTTSWGTGIEQQSLGFVTYSLRSWLERIESAISRLLPRGQFVKFNIDALVRADIKTRYEAYRLALESGWRNPDEVRALEDLPPIPDGAGQMFRQPLNFGPLGVDPTDDGGGTPPMEE